MATSSRVSVHTVQKSVLNQQNTRKNSETVGGSTPRFMAQLRLLTLLHLLKVEDPWSLKYFVAIILSAKLKGVSIHHSKHTNHTSCKLSLNSFNFPAIAATLALSNDIKDVCKRKKHKVGRSSKQNFLKHLDINYLGKVRVLRHGRTFTRWTELIPSLAWSVTTST